MCLNANSRLCGCADTSATCDGKQNIEFYVAIIYDIPLLLYAIPYGLRLASLSWNCHWCWVNNEDVSQRRTCPDSAKCVTVWCWGFEEVIWGMPALGNRRTPWRQAGTCHWYTLPPYEAVWAGWQAGVLFAICTICKHSLPTAMAARTDGSATPINSSKVCSFCVHDAHMVLAHELFQVHVRNKRWEQAVLPDQRWTLVQCKKHAVASTSAVWIFCLHGKSACGMRNECKIYLTFGQQQEVMFMPNSGVVERWCLMSSFSDP